MKTFLSSPNGLSLQLSINLHPWPSSAFLTTVKERNRNQIDLLKRTNLRASAKGFTNTRETGAVEGGNGSINKERSRQGGTDNSDDEIPQEVMTRMMVRIVISVVAPMVIGLGLTSLLGVMIEQHLLEVPKWLPYLPTFLGLGTATMGIPYGALSTPWDVNKKGSFLGFEQIENNWNEMWKEEDDAERGQR